MSSDRRVALEVRGLSKRYRLGPQQRYRTLREGVMDLVKAPLRLLGAGRRSEGEAPGPDLLWAVKDVSFDVHVGEVVGVIGHNGAGKTTILKLLSRITRPTRGEARVYGRVGALLAVGTGFHPELTGRENIYLNGAILGMTRREIKSKFAAIVAFSGLERFLDTPSKRYSQGMNMRLAFAVAAHLEPEILLIDEVLAVGDIEFQRRCLGKMDEVARSGRTILFVSHNMAAVQNLCTRCIVLRQGELDFDGPVDQAILRYVAQSEELSVSEADERELSLGGFRLVRWSFAQPDGSPLLPLRPALLAFEVEADKDLQHPGLQFQLFSPDGLLLFSLDFRDHGTLDGAAAGARVTYSFALDSLPLIPGTYYVHVFFKNLGENEQHILQTPLELTVGEGRVYADRSPSILRKWFGHFALSAEVRATVDAPA